MWTKQRKKRRSGALIVPALATVFLSYFGFHAWHGEFGIYSSYQLVDRKAELEAKLAGLRGERHALEARGLLLQDGTIEKDMLDEQARRALNLTAKDEVMIIRSDRNSH
ncbi:septum formation initiator family protein [Mesorhizobium sp. J428]|uniref:FtsB family cell division protein n=1 Tax=Mesorhizobium sp. J428 TaxID=2898440 RepID=UPI002151C62A|nr:septum formation initiator family protein [Mesorhizobium sp. J428]MCR5859796.1 septum formation initiator family protein [Mesorhizobium sp. J428]